MQRSLLPLLLSAGLLALAAYPASAEPAECDLMCRLQSYLSTDHMAAPPETAAPAPAQGKAHQGHHHPVAAKGPKAAPVAATPAPVHLVSTVARAPAPKMPPEPRHEAPPKVTAEVHRPVPAAIRSHEAQARPADNQARPKTVAAAHERHRRVARTLPAAYPTIPLASADPIPGSAKTLPAAFQYFSKM